ncbi:hypothetical protein GWC77_16125 [Paraburkholderia sp. NMBU_R16]|uniref:putative adhesin n=1 Tax=Paraburkholderia sp. NMBU_R16 TaxID=2698676 RepID=UPI001566A578|nr:hypothetical protein [Paraburkholderia sp. NMBU_R16]NRO97451.1 hypothetical protein [Paraburkholderia sp. NMBU_R16]
MTTVIKYKNVVIKSADGTARKALLLSHGGYTPDRGFLRHGSGQVSVPQGLTLHFNSTEDRVSIGTRAAHLLQGYQVDPVDTKSEGNIIKNYSLEYDSKFGTYQPNEEYDLIIVSPDGKAHMNEVFDAIRVNNKNYESLHSFACRVNKLTFEHTIQRLG